MPYTIDQQAGVAGDGTIVAWDYEAWYRITRRPARLQTPATSSPACSPDSLRRRSGRRPAAPAGGFNNGSNAASSYVAGRVGG